MSGRRVPKAGPEGLFPNADAKGAKTILVKMGDKIIRGRLAAVQAPRDLSPDEYAGPRASIPDPAA